LAAIARLSTHHQAAATIVANVGETRLPDDFAKDVAAIERIAPVASILQVICQSTGMGFAAVARVTPERWVACAVLDEIGFGLKPGGELKIETTICHEIRQSGQPVIINHVAEDAVFSSHHTPALYGFQSYISVPIRLKDGAFFGTLCAIDPHPAKLDKPETVGMFRLFADLIASHLEAELRLAATEANLLDERNAAELREQFIAVLGHDLRNPLASIDAGTKILLRDPANEKSRSIATLMQQSVLRMAGLIDNVLDFARGRLGGGFVLHRQRDAIQPTLEQVVAELQSSWPDRRIETAFDLGDPVDCDQPRIAQLLSNLLANALIHGSANGPVEVRGATQDGCSNCR
jgi:K+-sensing histidine kinase KdpD